MRLCSIGVHEALKPDAPRGTPYQHLSLGVLYELVSYFGVPGDVMALLRRPSSAWRRGRDGLRQRRLHGRG